MGWFIVALLSSRRSTLHSWSQSAGLPARELKQFEAIAQPVLELFELFFRVKEMPGTHRVAQWKLFDTKSKKSCYLFLTQSFEWTLEPLKLNGELPECFDFDSKRF